MFTVTPTPAFYEAVEEVDGAWTVTLHNDTTRTCRTSSPKPRPVSTKAIAVSYQNTLPSTRWDRVACKPTGSST